MPPALLSLPMHRERHCSRPERDNACMACSGPHFKGGGGVGGRSRLLCRPSEFFPLELRKKKLQTSSAQRDEGTVERVGKLAPAALQI